MLLLVFGLSLLVVLLSEEVALAPRGWIKGAVNVSVATCPLTMDSLGRLFVREEQLCDSSVTSRMVRYFPSEVPDLLFSLSRIGEFLLRDAKSIARNTTEDFVVSIVGDLDAGLQYYASIACDSEYNLVNDIFWHRFHRRLRFDYRRRDDSMGFKKCGHSSIASISENVWDCIRGKTKWVEQAMNSNSITLLISPLSEEAPSFIGSYLPYLIESLEERIGNTDEALFGIINMPRSINAHGCTSTGTKIDTRLARYFANSTMAFVDSCRDSYEDYPLHAHCIPWTFKSGDSLTGLLHRQIFHQLATVTMNRQRRSTHRKLSQKAMATLRGSRNQRREQRDVYLTSLARSTEIIPAAPLYTDNSSLDYALIESRAKTLFEKDPFSPIMMSVLDELLVRKSPEWFASREGLYITSGKQLTRRLDDARTKHKRDCRRDNALLLMCVITKNDDIDIQEWLVWQIMIVGAHHILVYVNIPMTDNTLEALRPFQEAGYVSIVEIEGSGKQPDVYDHCVKTIRRKVCHYPGYGPFAGNGSEAIKDCAPHEDPDIYKGKDRVVWLSAFDSDEFALSTDGACMIDELGKYNEYNGLMIPWFCMGHSQHFLTPKDTLVTEAYTHRMPGVGGLDKAFNRFYCIDRLPNSHVATFKNKQMAVDEFFEYSNYEQVGKFPAKHFKDELFEINGTYPKYRLYHYMTKSVEHLVKKWSRGMADYKDQWGRSMKRPLDIIVGWLKGFATEWKSEDTSVLEMSRIVRTVLYG